MIKNKVLSVIFKVIIVIMGIYGLLDTSGLLSGVINDRFLLFFTNLSNLMVVIYFIGELIYLILNRDDRHPTWLPTFKHICVVSMMVTCLIAHFMLESSFTLDLIFLHYLVPIMTLLDWLLFDEKHLMNKYSPFISIIPAYVYLIFTYIRIFIFNDNWYPYPFLNIDNLGIINVLVTILLLTIGFIVLGYILYFIDSHIKSHERNYY